MTGVRRSELIALRISDINFQTNEALIARRADTPDDPRANQPLAKTRDRLLPLSPSLARDTHDYILKFRRDVGSAKRHPFIFVANYTGNPLSQSTVNQIFEKLRSVPGIVETLHPHLLRHTWNDRFSELSEREGFSDALEQKIRARAMGWSDTSDTAKQYTKRFVREKADKAALSLQQHLLAGRTGDG